MIINWGVFLFSGSYSSRSEGYFQESNQDPFWKWFIHTPVGARLCASIFWSSGLGCFSIFRLQNQTLDKIQKTR
ncbi:hypothetical protein FKM82_004481 [Ascaphus truei]